MSLVVEDGSGRADAESYASVEFADSYHAMRGNSGWSAIASEAKEQALRRGTDFMVQEYRELWAGSRMSVTQRLDWPRYDVPIKDAPAGYGAFSAVYPYDEVPGTVAEACAELALRAISAPLAPDLTPPVLREKVGPLEVEYAQGARQQTRYQAIDNMLAPFLKGGRSTIPVVRS